MKKTAPGNPKTLEIITPNEIMVKFWFLRRFYRQLWKIEWMRNSSELTKTDVSKNRKKNRCQYHCRRMTKQGGSTISEINISKDVWQKSSFLLKSIVFLCSSTLSRVWPDWTSRRTLEPLTLFGEKFVKLREFSTENVMLLMVYQKFPGYKFRVPEASRTLQKRPRSAQNHS